MKLSQLLAGVQVTKLFQTMFGRMVVTHDVEVQRIQYDSRKVGKEDCFVAIRGTTSDGHRFIQDVVSRGARVVVVQDDAALPDSFFMHAGVIKVVVPDSRKALAQMAANFYGHPSRALRLIGVTGTNGKTTTTNLIRGILEAAGEKVGMIGTIEYRIGSEIRPAHHTTPESLELNEIVATMRDRGCTSVSMEVSSHALHQSRVYGLDFDIAVFTNLTQDHLDYHGTMEEYFKAKKILFDSLKSSAHAIYNADDERGILIVDRTMASKSSYGVDSEADVRATNVRLSINGSNFDLNFRDTTTHIDSPLVGRFNVYNSLAASAVGLTIGLPIETIQRGLQNIPNVKGRFERVTSPAGWTAIIDYAHTPDALEKCLRTIHDILPQKRGTIFTVFGAGGDRDRAKRPLMGAVVAKWSDVIIVTSDNPRTEDPERILDEILTGVPTGASVIREVNRRRAIELALSKAAPGDVILIAGKGHEEYQILGTERVHFSDKEVVEEFIRSHA